ncbi:hypothetical protein [Xanthomonas sacchari]|uniref:hypothetical protein n=1 Tax=Xanthomonas sacchari TaxID=56458 RepID=UPI0022505590|nr:hypothetical protein [Xanthomonas sacchari]MCW0385730.1 hypothetical protein [Xanthomonas sacchari]MCW0449702.1 hypothetical protein [Xanthomonas sacchari]
MDAPTAPQSRQASASQRRHGIAALVWTIALCCHVYLGLIRPAPTFGGSGVLSASNQAALGLLTLLVLATTPSAWRWLYQSRHRTGAEPVRIPVRAGRVALLCPLAFAAWQCLSGLRRHVDANNTLLALSLLFLAAGLLTLPNAWQWLRQARRSTKVSEPNSSAR